MVWPAPLVVAVSRTTIRPWAAKVAPVQPAACPVRPVVLAALALRRTVAKAALPVAQMVASRTAAAALAPTAALAAPATLVQQAVARFLWPALAATTKSYVLRSRYTAAPSTC